MKNIISIFSQRLKEFDPVTIGLISAILFLMALFLFMKIKSMNESQAVNPEKKKSKEEKEEEIAESLAEIYEDDNGERVDVKKFDIRKKKGFIFWFSAFLIFFGVLALGAWFYYDYYSFNKAESRGFNLAITSSKDKIISGEEYSYIIKYTNAEKVALKDIEIKVTYPEDYIYLNSNPQAIIASSTKNNVWRIDSLLPNEQGEIEISGKMLAKENDKAIIVAEVSYFPVNFSSEFKKSATLETVIKGVGFNVDFEYFSNILVKEENEIIIKLKPLEEKYLDKLIIKLDSVEDNLEIIHPAEESNPKVSHSKIRPEEWEIDISAQEEIEIPIKFKVLKKIRDAEQIKIKFLSSDKDEKYHNLFEKQIDFEITNGTLALNLIVNGSKSDQGINIENPLNYSLSYKNAGEKPLKNVIIFMVIAGDLVDWDSLADENNGQIRNNTLSWTREEIPALAELAPGKEGEIDFTLNLDKRKSSQAKSMEIKSYAYFGLEDNNKAEEEENKSNQIINKVNSELSFKEELRYFNEDNIAVGSGPIPPKVGETTNYKIFWEVGDNIHELGNVNIEVILPEYVHWSGKELTTLGSINYNSNENKVIWEIGRLPVLTEKLTAEFSVSVTPAEDDKDKIMVITPGAKAEALDKETQSVITKTGKAKTTRLEDDEIGGSDGQVQ